MHTNPQYPTPETVAAVLAVLGSGAQYSDDVEAVLAAHRRVEQEEASKRFSREWWSRRQEWDVRDCGNNCATVSDDGVILDMTTCGPKFARALAAYVEAHDWNAPEVDGSARLR
jgi:hypothetical protein